VTPHAADAQLPVVIVGAGPIGLITALGLRRYRVPYILLEEDSQLSLDTKAGTVLTRTLEVIDRYGALEPVLSRSLRIDEIGEIDRPTGRVGTSVHTEALIDDTRFPFVVNIPQDALEDALLGALNMDVDAIRFSHRVVGFTQHHDRVTLDVETLSGRETIDAAYVLACDGGRSAIRTALGIEVEGTTLEERYMLVDLKVDLDVQNPRDYPYLAYFADPQEWMILVRQPHCWRFLFPLKQDAEVPDDEALRDKALHFIGDVGEVEILGTNVYTVHQRVARQWNADRIYLMGDAAHLITPMWALGLNTGALDASNLPWRLAWVFRGWADRALLDGFEREQSALARLGSAQMAEAARKGMNSEAGASLILDDDTWGFAMTRTLLGVSLDVDGSGDWTIVRHGSTPEIVRAGDRAPDMTLFTPSGGAMSLHALAADTFLALHFEDARRAPTLPADDRPGLVHRLVSRWDAPLDGMVRDRSLFDPGDRVRSRLGVDHGTVVLLRPDGHVAAVIADEPNGATEAYEAITRPRGSKHDNE
jgi:3-(3-hydroxy-phenyl)propionate hydroxylase